MQNITFSPTFFSCKAVNCKPGLLQTKARLTITAAEYLGNIDITPMNVFERLQNITLYKVSKPDNIKWRVLNATEAIWTLADISLHSRCRRSLIVRSPKSSKKIPFAFASSALLTFPLQKMRQNFSHHVLVSQSVLTSVQNHDWERKT